MTQQELTEARSATTRALEAKTLKERQVAALREEQLQEDREINAIQRHLNSSEATAREAQMEVQRQFMLPPTTTPAYSTSNSHS